MTNQLIYDINGSFFSIYYLTMLSYLLVMLNFFFILFNINTLYLNSTESIKFIVTNKFYLNSLIINLLSFMGLPPLLGFLIKFWQISFFFNYLQPIFLIIFVIYNVVVVYFYLYLFKYLVDIKKNSIKSSRSQFSLNNSKFHTCILIINSLNVFAILYINNIVDYLQAISTFLYF